MKLSDSGDFCMLFVEADDDRSALVQAISGQKKPVVILLADQTRLFHSPEDFNNLKHVKRQLDLTILFVISGREHLIQLAARYGFPSYPSMDALSEALMVGSAIRQRRPTSTSLPSEPLRKTRPLVTPSSDRHEWHDKNEKSVWDGENSAEVRMPTRPLEDLPSASYPLAQNPAWTQEDARRPTAPLPEKQQPAFPPPFAEPPALPRPRRSRNQRSLVALAILMLIALLVAGLGSFMVFFRGSILQTPAAPVSQSVGHISFLNSQQVSESSSQGIDDEILIDLNSIPAPAPHKSYYAWLLGDHVQSDLLSVPLGALSVNKGHATLLYPGDAAHTNLLLMTSRFLVTEEDATVAPVAPSPDESTWCYYGEFSQTPIAAVDNVKHFSFLDHLRHLLAADPTLDQMELPGGLNTWLYNNTSKLLEWTTSMREPWEDSKNIDFTRRQSIRILDYLDGIAFVSQDLPPNTPVLVNGRLGSVGLLEVAGPAQDPPGYLSHIVQHLNGLLEADKFSPQLRNKAALIVNGLDNIQTWLEQVRSDARQIMRMSDTQLRQPAALALINDMISNVSNAFAGEPDPITGQMHEGVSWIHENMQALATIDIAPYHASSSSLQIVQDLHHLKASLPPQEVH
jgi:hypothetical protein